MSYDTKDLKFIRGQIEYVDRLKKALADKGTVTLKINEHYTSLDQVQQTLNMYRLSIEMDIRQERMKGKKGLHP